MRYFFISSFWILLLIACTPDVQEAKELDALDKKIMKEGGRNVEIIRTDKGHPTLKIEADKVTRFEEDPPYMEFPVGMHIYVYDDKGEIESVLKANYGKMAEGSEEMLAERDVVVVNREGEQLNTEHLVWNSEDKKIRSDSYVKISTQDEIIYGTGFEADENFTNYVIDSISGIVTVKDGEF